jgi:glucose/arabinose dehydrogenase
VRRSLALLLLVAIAAAVAAAARSESAQTSFRPRPLVSGLSAPVFVTGLKGQPGRLYVVEQGGLIKVVDRGKVRAAPFLDVRGLVTAGGEQGLLGLAFHPKYATNKRFYVQYTARNGDTRVVEYRSNGTAALPRTARLLFSSRDPYGNHNAGMLAFGTNGRLHFSMGDGGSGGDPENRAQSPRSLFGKLLSLNVATKGLRIEGIGLRNPWRFSFDRATGDLVIGDVGQGDVEEIDFTAKSAPGLENYGWDVFEGTRSFESKALGPGRLVRPIAQYSHSEGCSVTGGYVYRGANKALRGRYIYGDYCSGTIWSFKLVGGKATAHRTESFKVSNLTSFGEDNAGELYAVSGGGAISRLTP